VVGHAQEISGELQPEVVTVRRALESQPKGRDLLYLLGQRLRAVGETRGRHLEKVAPGSSRSETATSGELCDEQRVAFGGDSFQSALAASPNRAGLHVELGEVLYAREK